MKLNAPMFTASAAGGLGFLTAPSSALDVDKERDEALALGMTGEQFDEVLALCARFGDDRGWNRETFVYNLHTRMMIRGSAEMWPSRYWDVPHLSSLELLDPHHQEGEE